MINEFKEVDFNNLKDDVNKGRSNHKLEITLTVEIDNRDLKIKNDNSFENDNHIFERSVSCDKFGVGNRESYFKDLQLKEEQMNAELNCLLIKPVKSIYEREELISSEHLMNSNFDNNVRNYVYHMYSTQQSNFNKLNSFIRQLFPNHILIPKIKNNVVELLVETNGYEMTQVDISKMGDGFKNALLILSKILFSGSKIVLLDEPDIGMHPDLLENFVKIIKDRLNIQVVICSHNENLVNYFSENFIKYVFETNPISSKIVPLNLGSLNNVLKDLGVVKSNFNKMRLIQSKMVIFIEGKDEEEKNLLQLIKKINPDIDELKISFETTSGGGLISQDHSVIDKIHGEPYPFLIIRDRDELDEEAIKSAEDKLSDRVHIWKRREIENYWFDYDTILSVINEKLRKRKEKVENANLTPSYLDETVLTAKVMSIAEDLKISTILSHIIKNYRVIKVFDRKEIKKYERKNIDAFMSEYIKDCDIKINNIKNYVNDIEKKINQNWNPLGITSICAGSDLFSKLNRWLQEEYNVNVNSYELIERMKNERIDPDVYTLNNKIKKIYPTLDPSPVPNQELSIEIISNVYFSSDKGEISVS